MAVSYATRADLYRYGLPRGLLSNPGRLAATVSTIGDTFELEDHGFESGAEVQLRAEAGGALPAPLVGGTIYYVLRVSDSLFRLAETLGGAVIDLTSEGGSIVVAASLEPTIDAELERCSRLFDTYLPAHAVPLVAPFPAFVSACVAKLAAAALLEITGQSSALVQASAEQTRKEMARLAGGINLRDPAATSASNCAIGWYPAADRGGPDTVP